MIMGPIRVGVDRSSVVVGVLALLMIGLNDERLATEDVVDGRDPSLPSEPFSHKGSNWQIMGNRYMIDPSSVPMLRHKLALDIHEILQKLTEQPGDSDW